MAWFTRIEEAESGMDESVGALRELLTLDELTNRVGMSVRNVRFYTTKGLVPPPIRRGRSGYYTPDHVARLAPGRPAGAGAVDQRAGAQAGLVLGRQPAHVARGRIRRRTGGLSERSRQRARSAMPARLVSSMALS